MNKTFTPKQGSGYFIGQNGLGNSANLEKAFAKGNQVMDPDVRVVNHILNYARSLEVFKPKNNLVFFFVKN